jgi:hypothetical protein
MSKFTEAVEAASQLILNSNSLGDAFAPMEVSIGEVERVSQLLSKTGGSSKVNAKESLAAASFSYGFFTGVAYERG